MHKYTHTHTKFNDSFFVVKNSLESKFQMILENDNNNKKKKKIRNSKNRHTSNLYIKWLIPSFVGEKPFLETLL